MGHAKRLQHDLPFEALADNLWRVVGSLRFPPIPRNMFIYRLPNGGLLLDSVIAMDDDGMRALETLGRPEILVVPHPKHTLDAQFYKDRYPWLCVFGEHDAQMKLPALEFDAELSDGLAGLGLRAHPVPGMRMHEVALELPIDGAGKALLFADLVNRNEADTNLLAKVVGAPGDGGVARILKLTQIGDTETVRQFLLEMSALPALSLVAGCHGGVVTEHCDEWLRTAAERL